MQKYFDGFDHYGLKTDTPAVIAPIIQAAGWTLRNIAANTFAIVDGRLPNSLALQFNYQAGVDTNPSASYTVNSNADKVIFGFAVMTSKARMRVARVEQIVDIGWDATTGKLSVVSGSNTVVSQDIFILDAWYYLEIVIDKTLNQVKVYANDTLQITIPLASGTYSAYTLTLGQVERVTTAAQQTFDDLYINDSAQSANAANMDRLGPCQVTTRFPTADVQTDWNIIGGTGTPTHYSVAARPASANQALYLQTNTDGATDMFRSNAVLPDDNQVFACALVSFAKKGDLDARKIGLVMKVDTTADERQVDLTTSFAFQQAIYEQAPGGAAWDRNKVESTQFGIIAR
ncbi:hypothetical protein WK13_34920 [Burkholderia ubonensis]|uniref:hypothetical protein n=1 Tax=Burkholderia ubonensis TaxID=101571 RepID=UPI00075B5C62|nr:hypothetical protein [Burkholderia ubonensis]KVR21734.1 hypothetical protein WK13_34920 [Burkholderia ubonensis]